MKKAIALLSALCVVLIMCGCAQSNPDGKVCLTVKADCTVTSAVMYSISADGGEDDASAEGPFAKGDIIWFTPPDGTYSFYVYAQLEDGTELKSYILTATVDSANRVYFELIEKDGELVISRAD